MSSLCSKLFLHKILVSNQRANVVIVFDTSTITISDALERLYLSKVCTISYVSERLLQLYLGASSLTQQRNDGL